MIRETDMRMKIAFEIADDQRKHMDNIFQQHNTKALATRNDIAKFLGRCMSELMTLTVDKMADGDAANRVMADIDNRGWLLIGEPATTPL